MSLNYTTNLGLAEPVTGTESGTWGDDVNKGLTDYLDIAVAGTQTISGSQTAVTLSLTNGSSAANNIAQVGSSGSTGTAQYAIINCTGNPASMLTITVPASSRKYTVINATTTNQSVKIVGAGPTTGVTLVAGEKADVVWNGVDFTKLATTVPAAGGANTQVQYNNSGVLAGNGNFTYDSSGRLNVNVSSNATGSALDVGAITANNKAIGIRGSGGTSKSIVSWTSSNGAAQYASVSVDNSKTMTFNIDGTDVATVISAGWTFPSTVHADITGSADFATNAGTWSSTSVTIGTTGTAFSTITLAQGGTMYYMKVGNRCFWKLYFYLTGVTGGTGYFLISGLPYAAVVNDYEQGNPVYCDLNTVTTDGMAYPSYFNGQTFMRLLGTKGGGLNLNYVTAANVSTATGMTFSAQGNYQVA